MITMAEIARLTGVSQPTVSRVLNGNKTVNPEIREKVLACAREHDFQPNVMAQSLVGSRTKLIGVIVTDIGNAFFADLVKYIEQEAGKAGYSIILFNTGYDAEHEKECLDVVRRYRIDGLVLVPVDENAVQWRSMVRKLEIPVVVITRKASGVDSYYLAHDEAGALAGRHLAEQGYEEYLFLGNTRDMKYRGFVDALAKIRPDFGAHLTVITTKKTEEIRQALEEHFKKTDHCTGIFTYNDRRAIQALGILEEMGIRIPEQAGVIGFDIHRLDHPDDKSVIDHPLHAELISRESSLRKRGEK